MRTIQLLLTAAASALATSASASTQVTFVGPNSGSATQSCSGQVGPKSGSGIVRQELVCSAPAIGTAIAGAVAAPGHLGADARADSHNGDSLAAENAALAEYIDFVTFTSSNPADTTTVVAADFFLDGFLEVTANASDLADYRVFTTFGGQDFDLRLGRSQDGPFGFFNSGFVIESGTLDPTINAHLRTSGVVVPLNSPIMFRMILEVQASASGPGGHGQVDLGEHSFKLAPTPFLLSDGVTANAGDNIVDNHFIDPLAPTGGVPEPAAWALMILGFGAAGATLRRRRTIVA